MEENIDLDKAKVNRCVHFTDLMCLNKKKKNKKTKYTFLNIF